MSSATPATRGGEVLEALRAVPGGAELLVLAEERDDLAARRRRGPRPAARPDAARARRGAHARRRDFRARAGCAYRDRRRRWCERDCARSFRHRDARVGRCPRRHRRAAGRVLPRPRGASGGTSWEQRGGSRAARLHRQRDRRCAGRRASRASSRASRTRSRISTRVACAFYTSAASSRTPHACCASPATALDSVSSSSQAPENWPRARSRRAR